MRDADQQGLLRQQLKIFSGPLFDFLKDSPLLPRIEEDLLFGFLETASEVSVGAVDLLARLGMEKPAFRTILSRLLDEIPSKANPESVLIEGPLKFKEVVKIHRELQLQAIRRRAEQALAVGVRTR